MAAAPAMTTSITKAREPRGRWAAIPGAALVTFLSMWLLTSSQMAVLIVAYAASLAVYLRVSSLGAWALACAPFWAYVLVSGYSQWRSLQKVTYVPWIPLICAVIMAFGVPRLRFPADLPALVISFCIAIALWALAFLTVARGLL